MIKTPKKGSRYIYLGIAPSRSVYDDIYLWFEHVETKTHVFRKALRW